MYSMGRSTPQARRPSVGKVFGWWCRLAWRVLVKELKSGSEVIQSSNL